MTISERCQFNVRWRRRSFESHLTDSLLFRSLALADEERRETRRADDQRPAAETHQIKERRTTDLTIELSEDTHATGWR